MEKLKTKNDEIREEGADRCWKNRRVAFSWARGVDRRWDVVASAPFGGELGFCRAGNEER